VNNSTKKRRLPWIIGGLAAVALLVLGGVFLYARFLAPAPEEELALGQPAAAGTTAAATESGANAGGTDAGQATDLSRLNGQWSIATGSQAGYRVDEVLSGQPVTVVGRTSEVTGDAVVADAALTDATIEVELDSVATDNASRDQFFHSTLLDVPKNPVATFTLTDPAPLTALAEGTATVPLTGELTIAGATRPVAFDAQVQTNGNQVQVQGQIPMVYADYGITAPDLGFVKVEPEGVVEFLVALAR
jgi:polyisoprenoid-binding protein YceI